MKNTSITLGEHFTDFIGEQVNSGRYQSTSEVVRAGLRLLEEEARRLEALKQLVLVGEEQANNGEFVEYSLSDAIAEINNEQL